MIDRIIRFSLQNRLFVTLSAILITVYGVVVIKELPVDVFPDLNRPTVTIFSEAEGLAPEEVETLVTLPIETAVFGATGVVRVRSASGIGLSIVWVEFDWNMEVYIARQIVAERLQQISENMPEGINSVMGPISSIMGEITLLGLTSDNPEINAMDLRTIADWNLRLRLLSIPGIAQITVIGGDAKQYQALINPQKLVTYDVSLHEVEEALENANVNSTGGFIFTEYTEGLIRNLARVTDIEDLAKVVISKEVGNAPALTLDKVAEVRLGGPLAKRGDASVNAQPAVMLSIQKQPGADTVVVTKKIEEELARLKRNLPKGVKIHDDIFRQSKFIDNSITNVEEALRDGAILVAIVLFIFLLNFRTTFITLTAIPLSFVITAIVFKMFDMSINTMTLGGLAVAIGQLVDDAIVGVENTFRRLRENRQSSNPQPAMKIIYEAIAEILNSIVFATIIVVLVFVPLFAMSGIEGRIFAPLGIAYIVSLIASLLVSVTLTPALCYYLLPTMKRMEDDKDGALVRFLKKVEAKSLKITFANGKKALFLTLLIFVGAAAVIPFLGREFLPEFNEGSVTINILSAPGTSLKESNRIGNIAERLILEIPEVSKTGRRTGRAEMDDHAEGVHSSEIEVELAESDRAREEVLTDVRERLETIPGIVVNIGQPISHRIDHMLSGVRAQIALKIFGDDLAVLRAKAQEIKEIMEQVEGVVDLQVEKQVLIPQLHVRLDRDQAQKYGVMVGEVAEYVELALQGKTVSQVIENQKIFDIIMRFNEDARANAEAIRNIPVDTLRGNVVPLGLLASVEEAKGPNIITRENVRRRIVVQANTSGKDLVGVVEAVKKAIDEKVNLPFGYYITYGGQFESQASAAQVIAWLSLLSLAGMFLVLYAYFRSANLTIQIMISIPLAFIGAVIGVVLTGGVFSIASMVGFVALTGIAARNGILLVFHYMHLMKHEGERFDRSMIVRGTQERLVPVLMTALCASLALVPILLAGSEPGKAILHPVAVVIFSGLFTSTLFNMIVTPLIFWKYSQKTILRLLPDAVTGTSMSNSIRPTL